MTKHQLAAAVYTTSKSLTAFDAEIAANTRAQKLALAKERQEREHAARVAAALAFAAAQNSGFRRVA
jgi:hypothetical protein